MLSSECAVLLSCCFLMRSYDATPQIRELHPWSAYSDTEKKVVEYPRHGAMQIVADGSV